MKYITETLDVSKLSSDIRMAKAKTGEPVRLVMNDETKHLLRQQTEYLWTACSAPAPSSVYCKEMFCGCEIDTNRALPRGEILFTTEVKV